LRKAKYLKEEQSDYYCDGAKTIAANSSPRQTFHVQDYLLPVLLLLLSLLPFITTDEFGRLKDQRKDG